MNKRYKNVDHSELGLGKDVGGYGVPLQVGSLKDNRFGGWLRLRFVILA